MSVPHFHHHSEKNIWQYRQERIISKHQQQGGGERETQQTRNANKSLHCVYIRVKKGIISRVMLHGFDVVIIFALFVCVCVNNRGGLMV
jgi:hypothetical protein